MNIQAMMKQAQKIQKEMMETKNEIESKIYEEKNSLVTVTMAGNKELQSVKIDSESLDKDDIEMLEDMMVVAINNCIKKIDKELEDKMGKYTQGMPGLF